MCNVGSRIRLLSYLELLRPNYFNFPSFGGIIQLEKVTFMAIVYFILSTLRDLLKELLRNLVHQMRQIYSRAI